jgi:hypothetical protein
MLAHFGNQLSIRHFVGRIQFSGAVETSPNAPEAPPRR